MSNYSLRIVTDQAELSRLAERFLPPDQTFFETVAVRKAVNDAAGLPLYGMLVEENSEPVGLLPLAFNAEKNRYEWWGTAWTECQRIYVTATLPAAEQKAVKLFLLHQAPVTAQLDSMLADADIQACLEEHDDRYVLDLEKYPSWEAYLTRFSSKRRKMLKKRLRSFEGLKVEIRQADAALLPMLFDLNIQSFAERGGSTLQNLQRQQALINIANSSQIQAHVLGVWVNDELMAVMLGAMYHASFLHINSGVNYDRYPDMYVLTRKLLYEYALQQGAKLLDALSAGGRGEGFTYKQNLHFETVPLYRVNRKILKSLFEKSLS